MVAFEALFNMTLLQFKWNSKFICCLALLLSLLRVAYESAQRSVLNSGWSLNNKNKNHGSERERARERTREKFECCSVFTEVGEIHYENPENNLFSVLF